MTFFSKNVAYLREKKGLKQTEIEAYTGIKRTAWSNYESGSSKPNLQVLIDIAKKFGVTETDLLHVDLRNASLTDNNGENKLIAKSIPKSIPKAIPNSQNKPYLTEFKVSVSSDESGKSDGNYIIPITSLQVAAGAGIYNSDHIEIAEHFSVPSNFIKKDGTYLSVKVKGPSMAPTLQDGSQIAIRLLDRSEWAKMPDEYVYVVADKEGKGYLKRVKNRFKQDFIVLMSDNPDKATFPNFNLDTSEINSIWQATLAVSFKFPNIHDQYYSRLQKLEDTVDLILKNSPKLIQ